MSEFENNYTEFKNHSLEMQHNFFRAVEEREEGFFNSLAQLAQVSVDIRGDPDPYTAPTVVRTQNYLEIV